MVMLVSLIQISVLRNCVIDEDVCVFHLANVAPDEGLDAVNGAKLCPTDHPKKYSLAKSQTEFPCCSPDRKSENVSVQ